jgi:hypothetical protein
VTGVELTLGLCHFSQHPLRIGIIAVLSHGY